VIDPPALHVAVVLTSGLDRREREAFAYLIEENHLLLRQLGRQRRQLTDDDRRRLAARTVQVGGRMLREIATSSGSGDGEASAEMLAGSHVRVTEPEFVSMGCDYADTGSAGRFTLILGVVGR
jgi:hypothetical protein